MVVSERYVIATATAIGIVLIGSIVVAVGMALRYGRQAEITDLTPQQLADCGNLMQVQFPPQTEPLGFYLTSKDRTRVRLRVRMPEAAWGFFISSSRISKDDMTSAARHVKSFEGAPAWWQPDALTDGLSGRALLQSQDSAGELRMLRSAAGQDPVDVYLEWDGTAERDRS